MKSFHWNFTFWVGKVRSKNRLFEKRSILLHYSYFYAFMNFTIIELLIVISIIALLASMLLPVLGKTKSKAYGTKCMNNCKQLGFAFAGYHNDTDFWVPILEQTHGTALHTRTDTSTGHNSCIFKDICQKTA